MIWGLGLGHARIYCELLFLLFLDAILYKCVWFGFAYWPRRCLNALTLRCMAENSFNVPRHRYEL